MTRKKTTKDPINFGEEIKISKKDQICRIIKKGKDKFLTQSQREYYDKLRRNQITVCSGPAGVGKSFIAMKAAVDLLAEHDSPYEKIIIVRPAVEAEEKLGSLPGNVEEKLDPYIFPSYYLLNKINNPHKPNPLINSTKNNTSYKNVEVWEELWGGFSLNPGLRRKSDYLNFFPNGFSEFKDEIECSKYLISKKYKTVLLNETSCYHNGYNKRTNNFKH